MSDEKIKTAAGKVPLAMIPTQSLYGAARVYQYGSIKYLPGNFYNATLEDGAGARYIGAMLRHLSEMQLPNGLHTPESLAAIDEESGLPHIDHVLCGLMMLRSIMTKCGALPADPGLGKTPTTVTQRQKLTAEGEAAVAKLRNDYNRKLQQSFAEKESFADAIAKWRPDGPGDKPDGYGL